MVYSMGNSREAKRDIRCPIGIIYDVLTRSIGVFWDVSKLVPPSVASVGIASEPVVVPAVFHGATGLN